MNPLQVLLATFLAAPSFVFAQSAASAYTPSVGECPPNFHLIRDASASPTSPQTLSSAELHYVQSRSSKVLPNAWRSYFQAVQGTGLFLPPYVGSILNGEEHGQSPTLGIATSGGAYRAAIFGAGVMSVLDGRNTTSRVIGTGGLLQAATYVSGLSGGTWLISSLAQADFPTIPDLIFGSDKISGWNAEFDILQPGGADALANAAFAQTLVLESKGKALAGFPVSFDDIWSRGLSRHFVQGTDANNFFDASALHGAGVTFSGISDLPTFTSYQQPFPIAIADLLSDRGDLTKAFPDELIPLDNPVIEFNPFESGSFDPTLNAFVPTKYLGTQNETVCVTGFDQSAFIAGTSSHIFNIFNVSAASLAQSPIGPAIQLLNATIPQSNVRLDVALHPNPFVSKQVAGGKFIDNNENLLQLVDGAFNGEQLPLQPLLVKARGVDVILAIDASADTGDNFANGRALVVSQKRASVLPGVYDFPPVPMSEAEFIAKGLTTKPTFFGCDTSPNSPLIIYLPNGGPPRNGRPPLTNTSTDQLAFQDAQIRGMLDQTFDIALQGDGGEGGHGKDTEWPACLACAVVDKVRGRIYEERSGICQRCFERYCFESGDSPTNQHSLGAMAGSVSGSHKVNGGLLAGLVVAGLAVVVAVALATRYFTRRSHKYLPL